MRESGSLAACKSQIGSGQEDVGHIGVSRDVTTLVYGHLQLVGMKKPPLIDVSLYHLHQKERIAIFRMATPILNRFFYIIKFH